MLQPGRSTPAVMSTSRPSSACCLQRASSDALGLRWQVIQQRKCDVAGHTAVGSDLIFYPSSHSVRLGSLLLHFDAGRAACEHHHDRDDESDGGATCSPPETELGPRRRPV